MTVTAGNRALANRARAIAASAEPSSSTRRAAGCCAVALGTTRTVAAARAVLAGWDGAADVRAAALRLLEDLTNGG
jgi:hypothetical protein